MTGSSGSPFEVALVHRQGDAQLGMIGMHEDVMPVEERYRDDDQQNPHTQFHPDFSKGYGRSLPVDQNCATI
jgi:hypothetical protein